MKKGLFLLFCIFLLSGCSVNYDLEIGDEILEKTNIIENFSAPDYNYNLFNIYSTKPIPLSEYVPIMSESDNRAEGISYYDFKPFSDSTTFGINYAGNFNADIPLNESSILWFGVGNFDYREEEDGIYINVPSKIKIFEQFSNLDEINVNIKTDYNVIENNADKVNKNVYVWKINRDNYKNKTIKLKISKSSKLEEITEQDSMVTFSICLFILILFGFIIFLFVRMRFRKNISL